MKTENYYEEIEHLIKKNKINKKARILEENNDKISTHWHIGRLIVEAQGGKNRAKYGNGLIKKWSEKLTKLYGSNYSERSLREMRQFYLVYPKWHPVDAISWSNIKKIISIKDENKRNYYINLCIEKNLSKRELIQAIKDNNYERLLVKPKSIEIINQNDTYKIENNLKNPILIKLEKEEQILKEKDLQLLILAKLKNFFNELGQGYAFIGNEYKIKYGNKNYYIDILLFNVELNSYIVVELKFRELRKEDKAQTEFYMKIVDNTLKRSFHHKTIGIIITKEQDKLIANFIRSESIIPLIYKINNK